MPTRSICFYNKFGYCKFRDRGFRYHENNICENVSCSIQDCNLRHPKSCHFFGFYGKCKFGLLCKFKHETPNLGGTNNVDEEIVQLTLNVRQLNEKN